MSFPKNIIYNKTYEIEKFDKEKFIGSIKQFGDYNSEIVDKGLEELSRYNPVHVSRLVELGINCLTDEESAKKYYERYWEETGIFNRLRRITGYISSDLSTWNDAKKAEEKARIKHISSERKLTSQELKTVKEIEKLEEQKNYGKV
jgi:hypothetical protein